MSREYPLVIQERAEGLLRVRVVTDYGMGGRSSVPPILHACGCRAVHRAQDLDHLPRSDRRSLPMTNHDPSGWAEKTRSEA